MSTWAAILAGGVGTRFWPLSTPERPKQLLPLTGDRPLLAQTVSRLRGLVPPERMWIITNRSLVEPIAEQLPQLDRRRIVMMCAWASAARLISARFSAAARSERRCRTSYG